MRTCGTPFYMYAEPTKLNNETTRSQLSSFRSDMQTAERTTSRASLRRIGGLERARSIGTASKKSLLCRNLELRPPFGNIILTWQNRNDVSTGARDGDGVFRLVRERAHILAVRGVIPCDTVLEGWRGAGGAAVRKTLTNDGLSPASKTDMAASQLATVLSMLCWMYYVERWRTPFSQNFSLSFIFLFSSRCVNFFSLWKRVLISRNFDVTIITGLCLRVNNIFIFVASGKILLNKEQQRSAFCCSVQLATNFAFYLY